MIIEETHRREKKERRRIRRKLALVNVSCQSTIRNLLIPVNTHPFSLVRPEETDHE